MEIGQAIKTARENMKLNQREFANACGVTPAAVCQIEKGSRLPNLTTLRHILGVLGLTFEQLCEVEVAEVCPLCKQVKQ